MKFFPSGSCGEKVASKAVGVRVAGPTHTKHGLPLASPTTHLNSRELMFTLKTVSTTKRAEHVKEIRKENKESKWRRTRIDECCVEGSRMNKVSGTCRHCPQPCAAVGRTSQLKLENLRLAELSYNFQLIPVREIRLSPVRECLYIPFLILYPTAFYFFWFW